MPEITFLNNTDNDNGDNNNAADDNFGLTRRNQTLI